jgi:hypothetical protein
MIDKGCLVVAESSGSPPDAVLGVKLGGQGPTGESVVELLLGQPGREFPISIEPQAGAHMSNDVMDGPKSVIRATEGAAQQWVSPVAFSGARGDLQDPMSTHCADQLLVRVVRAFTAGELDSEPAMG